MPKKLAPERNGAGTKRQPFSGGVHPAPSQSGASSARGQQQPSCGKTASAPCPRPTLAKLVGQRNASTSLPCLAVSMVRMPSDVAVPKRGHGETTLPEGFAATVEPAWLQQKNKARVMQSEAATFFVRCTLDLDGDTEPVELLCSARRYHGYMCQGLLSPKMPDAISHAWPGHMVTCHLTHILARKAGEARSRKAECLEDSGRIMRWTAYARPVGQNQPGVSRKPSRVS